MRPDGHSAAWPSRLIRRLQQPADVAVTKGEVLRFSARGAKRNMVRHQHSAIANIPIDPDRLDHIHRTFVREDLEHHVVAASTHIAEMNQEYLFALTKPADHVVNLMSRVLQILRNRPLAEGETVVRALLDTYELLEPRDRTENARHAVIAAGGHTRIFRMERHANLTLIRDRHNPIEKVGYPF